MYVRYLNMARGLIVHFEAGPRIGGKLILSFARDVVSVVFVSFSKVPWCPRASLGIFNIAESSILISGCHTRRLLDIVIELCFP